MPQILEHAPAVFEDTLTSQVVFPQSFVEKPESCYGQVLQEQYRQEQAVLPDIPSVFRDAFDEPSMDETGRFLEPERPIELKWSAFGQLWLVKEMTRPLDGKTIHKIAAVSMSYPAGVGHHMVEEILRETLVVNKADVARWDGEKEGKIIAMSKELPDNTIDLSILDRFREVSRHVIARRHPFQEHEYVQHFYAMDRARGENMDAIKARAQKILDTPEFTGMAALTKEQEGAGMFVLELIIEDGVLSGADIYGERKSLDEMAVGIPHKKWIQWGKEVGRKKGNRIIGDGDSTEKVSDCGGSKTCSEFFNIMEQKNAIIADEKVVFVDSKLLQLFVFPTLNASTGIEKEETPKNYCAAHKKKRSECSCNSEEVFGANEA
ncbi:MAG: hypothetical protein HYT10_01750 [Candidatus Levybacteria bacterium]|nr:hypothetical protein [Candidatus Levybacteria bacterium]